jgi:hypothetical protein
VSRADNAYILILTTCAKTISTGSLQSHFSIDTAVGLALQKMLFDKFMEGEAIKTGFADSIKNSENFEENIFSNKIKMDTPQFGKPVVNESILWQTYGRYYDLFFKEKKDAYISIFGSTNTKLVDSIYNTLLNCNHDSQNKYKEYIDKKISWTSIEITKLPEPLKKIADTLIYLHVSQIANTSFAPLYCDAIV